MDDELETPKGNYLISFDRTGRNIVMTCTEHGVFYNQPKPHNLVGQNNVIWGQEKKHRKQFHQTKENEK